MSKTSLIPAEHIARQILLIRGQKVLLDVHLAELYGVETKVLNQAVKRNIKRFPDDFMFQLSRKEWFEILKSQIVTSSSDHGGRRQPPNVFTEQGVAMLSGVLNSSRAIRVNIAIMRTFVQLRQMLASNADLARKLAELEDKYDEQFKVVFEAIRELMEPDTPAEAARREIGFHADVRSREAKPRLGSKRRFK